MDVVVFAVDVLAIVGGLALLYHSLRLHWRAGEKRQ